MLEKLRKAYTRRVWEQDLEKLSYWRHRLIWSTRVAVSIIRDFFFEGTISLHATSLVYTALLSLVPLLAFGFSVLKAFGVQKQFEPMLYGFLEPLGSHGMEIGDKIMSFVDNIKVGVLGAVGLIALLYYIFMLAQKVEWGLNDVWHVKRGRSLSTQFSYYLTIIVIGPFLMVAALAITASVTSQAIVHHILTMEPFGWLVLVAAAVAPYILVIAAFTFIYSFVPHARVRFRSALVGGACAGLLWQLTGLAFAATTASSTRYTAVYSGFAIVILFMFWLYLCWLILLVGGKIAFYHQNPYFLHQREDEVVAGNRLREHLSLLIMFLVAERFYKNQSPWSFEELEFQLHVPGGAFSDVMEQLEMRGLLMRTSSSNPGYVPGRALGQISLQNIIQTVRCRQEPGDVILRLNPIAIVDNVVNDYDALIGERLTQQTLYDLVRDSHKQPNDNAP